MKRDIIREIISIIQSDLANETIISALEDYHDNDIASAYELLTDDERIKLHHILDNKRMSDIFSYIENPEKYISEMDHEHAADIIELMDADDAVDVLEELPVDDRINIINLLEKESSEDIKLIVSYDEDEIGSMMTTNYITIPLGCTVKEAMKRVIEEAPENDNIFTIFVLNEDNTYYGSIDLKTLIIARKDDNLDKIVKTTYPVLYVHEKIEESMQKVREYTLNILPVLDQNKHLVGVITSDDIIEAFEDQMVEDYAKLAGLSGEEDILESTIKSAKRRLPWLIILLFFDIVIAIFISGFEKVIITLPVLVFFQSLILDMAGNVGTQSLGVSIRILSEEKLTRKLAFSLLFKELKIGFVNGLLLSINAFVVVFLFAFISKTNIVSGYDFSVQLALQASLVVSLSLLVAMTFSSFVGALMPIFFTRIKVDPAVASGPFITTINDIIAVFVYYGLALLLFNIFIY